MVSVSSIVETVTAPIRAAANLARLALGGGEGDAKPRQRRSRGWRKHQRKLKAQQRRG